MMACSPEQRERLKALVEGERRWGPAPPARLGAPAYEAPILRALAERGGSARRKDVLAAVGAAMAERFGSGDREIVDGKPRWQADVDVARRRLFERGLVARGSREGVWVLSKVGAQRAGQSGGTLGSRHPDAEGRSRSIAVREPAGAGR
jgi:hypothetical protein